MGCCSNRRARSMRPVLLMRLVRRMLFIHHLRPYDPSGVLLSLHEALFRVHCASISALVRGTSVESILASAFCFRMRRCNPSSRVDYFRAPSVFRGGFFVFVGDVGRGICGGRWLFWGCGRGIAERTEFSLRSGIMLLGGICRVYFELSGDSAFSCPCFERGAKVCMNRRKERLWCIHRPKKESGFRERCFSEARLFFSKF